MNELRVKRGKILQLKLGPKLNSAKMQKLYSTLVQRKSFEICLSPLV